MVGNSCLQLPSVVPMNELGREAMAEAGLSRSRGSPSLH